MSDLFHRYLDGVASDAEVAAVSAQLRSSADARAEYLRLADLHARLTIDPAIWSVPRKPQRRKTGVLALLGWPVAAMLAVLLMTQYSRPDFAPERLPVATLLVTDRAEWSGRVLADGAQLDAGVFKLRSGRVALRLEGGTQVLVTGPAEFRLSGAGRMRLLRGETRVLVPQEATGFGLALPGGDVIGQSSEFAANVTASLGSAIAVIDGEVDVVPRARTANRRHLTARESIRLAADGGAIDGGTEVPAGRFEEALRSIVHASPRQAPAVVERFDSYAAGDYGSGELEGGTGWCGPWTWLTDASGKRRFSGKAKVMSIASLGDRPGWVIEPRSAMRQRRLCRPIDLGQDAVHYVGFRCFEPPFASKSDATADRGRTVVLSLCSVAATEPQYIGLRVDWVGRPTLETGMGQGLVSSARVPGGPLHLVAKIISRRSQEDTVFIRVFSEGDPAPLCEPDTWHVVSRGLHFDAVLDHATIDSRGPLPRRIDEIRIGSSWQEVAHGP